MIAMHQTPRAETVTVYEFPEEADTPYEFDRKGFEIRATQQGAMQWQITIQQGKDSGYVLPKIYLRDEPLNLVKNTCLALAHGIKAMRTEKYNSVTI